MSLLKGTLENSNWWVGGIYILSRKCRSITMMRQTGRKLDFIIIAVLAIAVVFFVFDKFF